MSYQLQLELKDKTIPIHIGRGLAFQKKNISFCTLKTKIVIVTDSNLAPLYGQKLKSFFLEEGVNLKNCLLITVPAGEVSKTRETKAFIENEMLKNNCHKDTLLIALGGGMICDLTAFVASTYYRGISFIMLPTSLLAMVDAAIGGKTSVNTPFGKNLIGNFYHPKAIIIDPNFLKTLPKKEYLNGLAEVIKYALILDKSLFKMLSIPQNIFDLATIPHPSIDQSMIDQIIYKCCLFKKQIVEKDEEDQNLRHILNFGHTVGHVLEHLDNYKISHGEAIALGMILASYLSYQKKFLSFKEFLKIFLLFKKHHYPLIFSQKITWKEILQKLSSDKKAKKEKSFFVLLEKTGKVKIKKTDKSYLYEINEEDLKKGLIWLNKRFASKKDF